MADRFIFIIVTAVLAVWLPVGCNDSASPADRALEEERRKSEASLANLLREDSEEAPYIAAEFYARHPSQFENSNIHTRLLTYQEPLVRRNTAKMLGHLQLPRAYPALRKAADDKEPEVRAASVEALAKLKDRRARFIFLLSLKDSSWNVRAAGASALRLLDDPATINYLIPLLADRDTYVRYEAMKSIFDLVSGANPGTLDAMEEAMDAAKDKPKQVLATALTMAGKQQGAKVLLEILPGSDDALAKRGVDALLAHFPQLARESLPKIADDKLTHPEITGYISNALKESKLPIPP